MVGTLMPILVGIRIIAVGAGLSLLALAYRRRMALGNRLRSFFLEPTSALDPALLRIVIFGLLLGTAIRSDPAWHAAVPASLRDPPPGWGILGSLPFHPTAAAIAGKLLVATSACACAGLFTRVTVPVSTLLAIYVLGLPYCFGKVNHGALWRMLG